MSVDQATLQTRRGDDVFVTLFQHADEAPSILVSVNDADDTKIPTAEFTLTEASELREILRKFCELAARDQMVGRRRAS